MRYPNLVLVVCVVLPIITEEVTPNEIDCNFQNDFCKWNKEEGWIFNADIPKMENNELYLYVREKGVYKPEINVIEAYNMNTFYIELWKGKETTTSFHVKMGSKPQTECKFDTWREWLVCNDEDQLQVGDKIFMTLTLENNGFVALRKNPEFDNCLESDCRDYLSNLGFIWNIPKLPPFNPDSDSYIVLNSEDNSVSIKSPEIDTNTDTTVTLKYWLNSETPEYSPTLSVFVEKNNKIVKLLPLTKCEDKIQEVVFKAGYTVRVDGPYKIVFAGKARGLDKAGVAILEVKGKHSPIEDTVIQVFWPRDVKIIYEMFQFYGWEISGLFEKRDISVELRQGFKEGVIRSRWMKWRKGMEVKLQYQCTQPASLEIEMIDVDGNAVISKPYDIVPGDEWIDVTVALNEQVEEFMIGIRGSLKNEDAKLRVQNIRVMHRECKDDSIYEPFEDSFICKCKESGFYYDYKEEKCLDKDKINSSCLLQKCSENKVCDLETLECKCKHNYRNKIDGDECEATTCSEGGQGYKHCKDKGENWECELSGDNYNCSCKHGFREVSGTCEDICKQLIPSCDALTQVCRITNTGEGSCECKATLVPDGSSKCQVDIGADKNFISGNFVIKNVFTSNEILDLEILTKYVDEAFKTFLGKNHISAEVTRFKVDHNDDLECFIVVETGGNAGDEFTTRIESPSIYIPTTDPNYVILPPNLVVLKSWLKKENFRNLSRCQETADFSYCPMGTKCSENDVSYWCTCSEGYSQLTSLFSGKDKDKNYPTEICQDKNECLEPDTCPENAKCRNLLGTYECNCKSGFRKHDNKCVEICNPSPCDNGKCEVVEESFFCRCSTGYKGRQCEDTDNEYKSLNAKAAIVGGVLGGLLFLVIIVVVILFYNIRKKQSRTRTITEGKDDK